MRLCDHRFFLKFFDPGRLVHPHRSEPRHILIRFHIFYNNGNVRFFGDMIFQYFIIIQLVHRIRGCNNHIRLMTPFQKIQILIDRICRSAVPVSVVHGNRRCKHIQTALLSPEIPPF